MKSTKLSTMIHFCEIYVNVFAKSKNLQIENKGRHLFLGDPDSPDRDVQTIPMSFGLNLGTCILRTCILF